MDKIHADLRHVLNEVADPELGIAIVDMRLIYRAEWTETGIEVDVTTTVLACPYAALIREQIDSTLRKRFSETASILVRLVFDPPWRLDRLSKEARQALGWAGPSRTSAQKFTLRCWSPVGQRKH
jgi:metal-sulfur cluster biosynthetic enzyme